MFTVEDAAGKMPCPLGYPGHISPFVLQGSLVDMASARISLDPDDRHEPNDQLFNPLRRFLEEACSEDERARFVRYTLPCLVNHAMHLRVVRPSEGFHYLLQQEERSVMLDRQFILSLLANAFFSTFPRRTIKTHPTLQDFNFVQLFQHLETWVFGLLFDSQQLKLKSILRHLEGAGYNDSCNGNVRYTRQVVSPASIPSLPHWLCSDKPLCPLVLRNTGGIEEAEPHVYKACFCSPLVGGDVLREGFSQESRLFSLMPELLVCICFAEALLFNEAIVVQGVRQNLLAGETDVCLLDASNFSVQPGKQYEDQALVRELTKCYAAFLQPRPAARLSPVGRSASPTPPPAVERRRSSIGSTQSFKTSLPDWAREDDKKSKNSSIYNHTEYHLKPPHLLLKQQSSNYIVPVRKYSDPFSICSRPERFSSEEKSTPKKVLTQESTESGYKRSLSRASSRRQKSEVVDPSIQIVETFISELLNHERKKRTLEKRKSRSWGQISQGTFSEDDEYFTADENMSDTELGISAEHRRRMLRVETPGSEESTGFHLGTDDELSKHERYEDFRRRIRCRTRSRRSRRSSSSYLGSSSDMEDISEEDMIDRPGVMRAASSEPNLAGVPLAVPPPPTTAPLVPGRRLMMTTYSGQLKAYSYDGVKPNLPVPFKAKFRRRRFQEDEDSTGGSSLEDLSVDSEVPVYNPYRRVESQDSSILPDDLDVDTVGEWTVKLLTDIFTHDYPSALMPTVEGLKPVAGGRWGCGTRHSGDPQLKVAIQWLAASLALLPSLVVYTAQDPALAQRVLQLRQVSRKAEKQGWTVGDLACETLRYCRSRRSSHRTPSQLFSLLLGGTFLSHDSLE
ncbi:hypothetical protein LAZ67_3003011 [Cordylochernes scorpioides]|uniref:poly(ADP-ribose) glycohydrolase n=1 Tax=Cordylochernes scorpioides TaxID=51811 RepID=A0ABY6K909_9ARAC|nr:hypothetical protein LAZ67_3003011 [Cordylochernes scorpioides]